MLVIKNEIKEDYTELFKNGSPKPKELKFYEETLEYFKQTTKYDFTTFYIDIPAIYFSRVYYDKFYISNKIIDSLIKHFDGLEHIKGKIENMIHIYVKGKILGVNTSSDEDSKELQDKLANKELLLFL